MRSKREQELKCWPSGMSKMNFVGIMPGLHFGSFFQTWWGPIKDRCWALVRGSCCSSLTKTRSQVPDWALPGSSLGLVKFRLERYQVHFGACQEACPVEAWNLSGSSLVKFGSCQVQAWNLPSSSLGVGMFKPRVCQGQVWQFTGSMPRSWKKLSSWSLKVL